MREGWRRCPRMKGIWRTGSHQSVVIMEEKGTMGQNTLFFFIYFFKKTIFIEKAGLLRKGETDPKTE